MNRKGLDYSKMTIEERKQMVEHLYIIYPRNRDILDEFEYCRRHAKVAAEAEGMLLEGSTGMGKTTLCKYYMLNSPRKVTEDGTFVPVLFAKVEVPASPKSLVTTLLKALGDPIPDKGSVVSQTIRLKGLIADCGTELIFLDEFQHFIDRDSKKVLKTISDWLKNLMEDTKVPIILIGMPYSHAILDAEGNEQLQRRFSERISLEPFEWSNLEGRKNFRKFLQIIDEKLPLEERSNLSDTSMAFRFYLASNGVVSRVMKLVRRATVLTLELSKERVELDILSIAYDECLSANAPEMENPFDECMELSRKKYTKGKTAEIKSTNNRSRAIEVPLRASDILP